MGKAPKIPGSGKNSGCVYAALSSTFGDSSTIFEDGVFVSGNRFLKKCKVLVKAYGSAKLYATARVVVGGTTVLSVSDNNSTGAQKELSIAEGQTISMTTSGTYGAWCRVSVEII